MLSGRPTFSLLIYFLFLSLVELLYILRKNNIGVGPELQYSVKIASGVIFFYI